ncbi:amidohydrolase family protein [Microbulbifer thermotolerans]|uniref:amidohydrolase family protein n=1 Tax=Microbulbifer thermotolerans TaxID=252514 RepID=UPI0022495200|nr:amidohydrolase family protein [Microbulbifer thermotolerans]MCX2832072.1 amidohydrolase family protein [Microbulbifer thermotolerans]MCX2842202.1 amidohydrolase family protein [Microbulbifer thermotolerans]
MKKLFTICVLTLGLATGVVRGETVLIQGGKVHTLTEKGSFDAADILVRDGRIVAVGLSLDEDADRVIDARGKVVTPGVIAPVSELGLVEIGAASATNDYAVNGASIGSAFDPLPAYNPKSTLIPFNRAGGVTRALVFPGISFWGGDSDGLQRVFAGRGFAIKLNGAFDSVVKRNLAQKAYLGEAGGRLAGGSRASAYAKIETALSEAREYRDNRAAIRRGDWRELNHSIDDLEALQGVLSGAEPLVVTVNRASDILWAIELADEYNIKLVIAGAAEGWMVAEQLAAAEVPVIIDAINNLPISFSTLGARLDNAALLTKAGVKVAISGPEYAATHNLYLARQSAGNAVAYGLPYEEGLRSISANVAEIFGLESGTLDPGAVADIVVWSGDPLEVTSYAEEVLIDGVPQSLVTRSTRLRDRYLKPQQGHQVGYKH